MTLFALQNVIAGNGTLSVGTGVPRVISVGISINA